MADNSQKRISGITRGYEQYVSELHKFTREFYPDILETINDASIGGWLIDLNASVADNLSNYIDRAFAETQLDQASARRSLLSLARTKGLKIPGKKASLVEVEITCDVPLNENGSGPDENFYPTIKKGGQATGGGTTFELLYDVNFRYQFDHNGISNRTIKPKTDSNGNLTGYTITKREIMSNSTGKIYKVILSSRMMVPFMEIVLPETNVLGVDAVICKECNNFTQTPTMAEFNILDETVEVAGNKLWKFFEMENLLEDKLFLPKTTHTIGEVFPEMVVTTEQTSNNTNGTTNTVYNSNTSVVNGEWKTIKQKFITEYTDRGYLKVIFGAGDAYDVPLNPTPTQKIMTKIINNGNMGILPKTGHTLWILYRTGGGAVSNVSPGIINTFSYKEVDVKGKDGGKTTDDVYKINNVQKSVKIRNISPAMGGKDEPSIEEIRYMIKYNNLAQNRCVTIKDYIERIDKMPGLYGTPYRTSILEKNNIIFIYVLGINSDGRITDMVTTSLLDNMSNYLSEYKMIGDYVIIKPGRVINVQVECDVIINKGYESNSVVRTIQDTVYNFFDINNHKMGDNIFVSQLIRELVSVSGVDNLIELRIYNVYGGVYNTNRVNQPVVTGVVSDTGVWTPVVDASNRVQIDLTASDNIIYGNSDSMFEIFSKDADIKIRVKQM
jgi:hypothetical protein